MTGNFITDVTYLIKSNLCLITCFVILFHEACNGDGKFSSQYAVDSRRDAITRQINQYRVSVEASDMQELVWDSNLATFALQKAKRCTFQQPSSYQSAKPGYSTIGLNFFATSSREHIADPVDAALQAWNSKSQYWTYGPFQTTSCPKSCSNYIQIFHGNSTLNCDHFIAVVPELVWATTCAVGCAAVNCSTIEQAGGVAVGAVVVCAFSGDIQLNKVPYTQGQHCGACPQTCTANKLCKSTCSGQASPTGAPFFPQSTPFPGPGIPGQFGSSCIDLFPLCYYWARSNQCSDNPSYMLGNCTAACSSCGPKAVTVTCANSYVDCQTWANGGYCKRNPYFMLWQCPLACQYCARTGAVAYPADMLVAGLSGRPLPPLREPGDLGEEFL